MTKQYWSYSTTVVTVLLFVGSISVIDCNTPIDCMWMNHTECPYEDYVSCYDYLLSGQRKSGHYQFRNSSLQPETWIWCEFDDNAEDVMTVVRNALEQEFTDGIDFHRQPSGEQKMSQMIENQLDDVSVTKLKESSSKCEQRLFFNTCNIKPLEDLLHQDHDIVLSAGDNYLSYSDLASGICVKNKQFVVNLPPTLAGVMAVGLKSVESSILPTDMYMTLGPLKCSGKTTIPDTDCSFNFPDLRKSIDFPIFVSPDQPTVDLTFNFRTVSQNLNLFSLLLSNGGFWKTEILDGWIVNLANNSHIMSKTFLSDGNWHKFRLRINETHNIVYLDTRIHIMLEHGLLAQNPSALHIGPGFEGCISNVKINGEVCPKLEGDTTPRLSDVCQLRTCQMKGGKPCHMENGCKCKCTDMYVSNNDCANLRGEVYTATFGVNSLGFLAVRLNDTPHNTFSFSFKTQQPDGMLAYYISVGDSAFGGAKIVQIYLENGAKLVAKSCRANGRELICTTCFIKRNSGFNDYGWHHITFGYLNDQNSKLKLHQYLFTADGYCRLHNTNLQDNEGVFLPSTFERLGNIVQLFLGGVPNRATSRIGHPFGHLMVNEASRSPRFFYGCISLVSVGNLHDSRRHLVPLAKSLEETKENLIHNLEVKLGCNEIGCTPCEFGAPCIYDKRERSTSCDCSSVMAIQKPTSHATCVPAHFSDEILEECVMVAKKQQYSTIDVDKQGQTFSGLWMTFQFWRTPAPNENFFSFINVNVNPPVVLAFQLRGSNLGVVVPTGSLDIVLAVIEGTAVSMKQRHLLVFRYLPNDNFFVQFNNNTATFSRSHLYAKLYNDYSNMAFELDTSLCLSAFVIQHRGITDERSREPVTIYETDLIRSLVLKSPNVQRQTAGFSDPAIAYKQAPLLRLMDTPYPPTLSSYHNSFEETDLSGDTNDAVPAWIIVLVIVLVITFLFVLLVIIVLFRRARRRRANAKAEDVRRPRQISASAIRSTVLKPVKKTDLVDSHKAQVSENSSEEDDDADSSGFTYANKPRPTKTVTVNVPAGGTPPAPSALSSTSLSSAGSSSSSSSTLTDRNPPTTQTTQNQPRRLSPLLEPDEVSLKALRQSITYDNDDDFDISPYQSQSSLLVAPMIKPR